MNENKQKKLLNESKKNENNINKLIKQSINVENLKKRSSNINNIVNKCCNNITKYDKIKLNAKFNKIDDTRINDFMNNLCEIVNTNEINIEYDLKYNEKTKNISINWNINRSIFENDKIKIIYKKDDEKESNIIEKNAFNVDNNINIKVNNFGKYIFSFDYFNGLKWFKTKSKSININAPKIACKWETNALYKGSDIKLNEKTQIISKNVKNFKTNSIFLTKTIKNNIHGFKFKIIDINKERSWLASIGIFKINTGKPVVNDLFSYTKENGSYCFLNQGNLEDTAVPGNNGMQYGVRLKTNDIIEMIVDLNECQLGFKINEVGYGKAFSIEKTEYKVGVAITLYSNTSIQFLGCTKY